MTSLNKLTSLTALARDDTEHGVEYFRADDVRALASQPAQAETVVPMNWDGAEEWMPLAWALCAEENGEDACTELVWEGGPIPEPWGDRWLKYEGEAKRLIALVRQHAPTPPQAQPAPVAPHCDGVRPPFEPGPMTPKKAAYFMERFKHEEKLLGPNEQAAIDYVLALLEPAPVAVDERIRAAFDEGFSFGKRDRLFVDQAWAVSKSLHAAVDAESARSGQDGGVEVHQVVRKVFDEAFKLGRGQSARTEHEAWYYSKARETLVKESELRRAVKAMTAMVGNGEWAEHVSRDPDAKALEDAITTLHNELRADEEGTTPQAAVSASQAVGDAS